MEKKVLIIGIILLVIAIVLFFITASGVKEMSKEKLKSFLYKLLISLLAASSVFLIYSKLNQYPLQLYISFQTVFFGLGIGFCFILYRVFYWTKERSFLYEFLFLLSTTLMSLSFFFMFYSFMTNSEYNYLYMSATFFFIVPFFVFQTFEKAILIPRRRIRTWECPTDLEVPNPSKYELQKPFVVSFFMRKNADDKKAKNYTVIAPREMPFGKLMFYFIKEYNTKNSEDPIQYTNRDINTPHEWVFYFKPKWYFPFIRYIDPELTVLENKLKEKSVIECRRVEY